MTFFLNAITIGDGLLMRVRKKLRQDYGYRQEKGKLQKKRVKSFRYYECVYIPTYADVLDLVF